MPHPETVTGATLGNKGNTHSARTLALPFLSDPVVVPPRVFPITRTFLADSDSDADSCLSFLFPARLCFISFHARQSAHARSRLRGLDRHPLRPRRAAYTAVPRATLAFPTGIVFTGMASTHALPRPVVRQSNMASSNRARPVCHPVPPSAASSPPFLTLPSLGLILVARGRTILRHLPSYPPTLLGKFSSAFKHKLALHNSQLTLAPASLPIFLLFLRPYSHSTSTRTLKPDCA